MKRFWKAAAVVPQGDSFAIELDGRPMKTPGRNLLSVPTQGLAEAIAAEWDAQGETVDPAAMPLTKLAQGAIDQVASNRDHFVDRIVAYAESDMLCYRADDRQVALGEQQARHWDPLLDWARERYDVSFEVVGGIMHCAQPEATVARLREAVAALDNFTLAATLDLVGLGGSLVLALALHEGQGDPDQLWDHSLIEEYWQESQWGKDAEAEERRAVRKADWDSAALFRQLAAGA